MAFNATLKMDGIQDEIRLFTCRFGLSQAVDSVTGRPTSGVMGGQIDVSFESTNSTEPYALMINPNKSVAGSIKFFAREGDDKVLRELKFDDAFVTSYAEDMSALGNTPMTTTMTISARKMGFGSTTHENKWAGSATA